MDNELQKQISKSGLTSCMNNTKWRELVSEITKDKNYNPSVNIKSVFDTESNRPFSPVWWEEVEHDGFDYIEWLEINPVKIEFIGRLVDPKKEDYSEFILAGLNKYFIPYEINNGIIRVYGYKATN